MLLSAVKKGRDITYNSSMVKFGRKLKFQISIALVILISVALYFLGEQIPKESIRNFIEQFGVFAPTAYILVHQLSYVLAPISGIPFLIIGFYMFGRDVVIYNYLVALIGFIINFFIARRWGRRWVTRFAGREVVEKIDRLSNRYGVVSLVSFRLIQGGIGDFVSYAYGFTPIKFSTYFVISAIATLPGSIIWYIVASKTNSIEQFFVVTLVLLVISLVVFYVGNFVLKRSKRHRFQSGN